MDDVELVGRARDGDGRAFEQLVMRHTDAVWRFARPLAGDDGAAEEIVQDTFVKAHRGLAAFRGESSVATWLHAICHRTAMDRLRRRRLTLVDLDRAVDRPALHASIDDRFAIDAAMAALPPDERAAFALVAVFGYSHDEAGAVVGAPASTMRSRYARARTRLVAALRVDDDEEDAE